MTVYNILRQSTDTLRGSRCHGESARLDAEILLAHVLHRDRTWLMAHGNDAVPQKVLQRFESLVRRRSRHEPVAYLVGYKDFYGLRLNVSRAVLIPRPETELLVDLAVRSAGVYPPQSSAANKGPRYVDVGTGSGAIAIALAKALPHAKIIATDVSPTALKVARENAKKHGVASQIVFRVGAGFSLQWARRGIKPRPTTNRELIVVANLPYLTTSQWRKTAPEIKNYEPRIALDCGEDGLEHYKELLDMVAATFRLRRHSPAKAGGYQLLLEIDPRQKQKIRQLVRAALPRARIAFHHDLAGKVRIAQILLTS